MVPSCKEMRRRSALFAALLASVAATAVRAEIVPYAACGELIQSSGFPPCLLHVADDGTVVTPHNVGSARPGDRIYISGTINTNMANICDGAITFAVMDNTVDYCVAECGTLVEANGCLRFDSDRGPSFVLQNIGDFATGARVYVRSDTTQGTIECNGETLPFVTGNIIGDCGEQTGRIVARFGCPALLTAGGERYDFVNFGTFGEGDYVSIQGALSEGVLGGCGNPLIESNSIRAAYGGAGTILADENCGAIFVGDETAGGVRFKLDNLGAFQIGDRVVVTGRIDGDCTSPGCDAPCLRGNTIGALTTACGFVDFGPTECLVFTPDDGSAPFALEFTSFPVPAPAFVAGTLESAGAFCDDGEGTPVMRHNLTLPCIDICGTFLPGFECTPLFFADSGELYWLDNVGPYGNDDVARVRGGIGGFCDPWCPFPCVRVNSIEPCDAFRGDVNGDGAVDLDDTALFVNVLLGIDHDAYRVQVSDVNNDGARDGRDIGEFVLIVLGWG